MPEPPAHQSLKPRDTRLNPEHAAAPPEDDSGTSLSGPTGVPQPSIPECAVSQLHAAPWPPQHDTHTAEVNTSVDAASPHTSGGRGSVRLSRAPPPGFLPGSVYSRAKAQLRRQLPTYRTEITLTIHWERIMMWLLTLAACVAAFGVRFVYLVTGRIDGHHNVSVPYSWVVLVAEVIATAHALYDTHLFLKQEVIYTPVGADPADSRDKVSPVVRESCLADVCCSGCLRCSSGCAGRFASSPCHV